ncbi:hypothetical protein D3C79_766900 [compost metagenome]
MQAVLTRQVVGSTDHVHAGSGVVQRFPEEILEPDRRTQPKAVSVFVGRNRVARHRLGAHAQHLLGSTAQLLTGLAQQLKSGAADTLHRQRRDGLRHAAVQAHMARQEVGIETGLGHAAGEHAVHRLRGDTCPRQHRTPGLDPQVDGRHSGQCAAQVYPGGAHHVHNGCVIERCTQAGTAHDRPCACS